MASLERMVLLPQCASCVRRVTRLSLNTRAFAPLQQVRSKTKSAKEAERNVVVKLRMDVPRFGRAGSYIAIPPGAMRNTWFPARIADYVLPAQLKQLKAGGVDTSRDITFGVEADLEEEDEEDLVQQPKQHYVRPIEINMLSPERSMELINTFIPPTLSFFRKPIEHEQTDPRQRQGASSAADVLTAAAMASKPERVVDGIYGSVSTADVVATIKSALAHNDEAARVLLAESDVQFLAGHVDGDASRVKQLGDFKVRILMPGAETPLTRNIRVRAKEN
ncbi:hypothetical protein K504DRAFT_400938 [Pleomassaria siparia CBS 279.74]|uniref:Ribosomal protein L9 domain-containing protein n=1 Tax=Pleomassaria siparia CBS 279.74 TaxID=1314801 RepID=A0A6G1KHL1_9PLEO|nr:hypothetical protein K504DRAFT_400938 [Pleomassaria siparia CBS 279.74]